MNSTPLQLHTWIATLLSALVPSPGWFKAPPSLDSSRPLRHGRRGVGHGDQQPEDDSKVIFFILSFLLHLTIYGSPRPYLGNSYLIAPPSPVPLASRHHLLRPLGLGYPCSCGGSLDEEDLGIFRELRANVATGVSLPHKAHRSPDALGLDRHLEAGSPITYLYRNVHHLRSPLPAVASFLRNTLVQVR